MQSWLDHDVFYERIQSEKKNPSQKCQKQVSFFPSWSRTLTAFGSRLPTAVKLYKVISRWCSSSGKAICKCQYIELNRKERLPFEKKLLRTHHRHSTSSCEWTCTFWKEGNSMSHLGWNRSRLKLVSACLWSRLQGFSIWLQEPKHIEHKRRRARTELRSLQIGGQCQTRW